jgi:hypothetical protein
LFCLLFAEVKRLLAHGIQEIQPVSLTHRLVQRSNELRTDAINSAIAARARYPFVLHGVIGENPNRAFQVRHGDDCAATVRGVRW